MKRLLATSVAVLSFTLSLSALSVPALALADNEYAGLTYEQAAADIKRYGTPVIVSRVGEYLPTEKCVVTGSRVGKYIDSSGRPRGGTVLLNLNCNDSLAGAHAGNSAATAEGRKIQNYRRMAKDLNADFEKATETGTPSYCDDHTDVCVSVCQRAGTCSGDLLKYLGL